MRTECYNVGHYNRKCVVKAPKNERRISMNAKKLLAVLVACAMIFGTMSFGVLASEDVELIETEEIAEEVVSEEAVEAAATELYVNCDYNI